MRLGTLLRLLCVLALCLLTLYRIVQALYNEHPISEPFPAYFTEVEHRFESRLIGAVSHIDSRFIPTEALDIEEVQMVLVDLAKSYILKMRELGVETWLAHGSLLGWYWGEKIFPWDTDVDVQMTADTLELLATQYNMTVFEYPDGEQAHAYLLDINPRYSIPSTRDLLNKIDARWIDIRSGRFIDITAVHRQDFDSRFLYCKDGHEYMDEDIFPLETRIFQGIWADIPCQPKAILAKEYGKSAITSKNHHWYNFDDYSRTWIPEKQRHGWWA